VGIHRQILENGDGEGFENPKILQAKRNFFVNELLERERGMGEE
jgi:hypothetical protein